MKKAPIILGLSLAATIALGGCGNVTTSEEAVVNKLSHELDRVTNTVAAVTMTGEGNLSISSISKKLSSTKKDSFTSLTSAYQSAIKKATSIEDNRERVLRRVQLVKRKIAGGIKLNSSSASAISELTHAMQKSTTSLSHTKSDYTNTVKGIAKLTSLDTSEIDAKVTRLKCCLEMRDCYLQNILSVLENIESIVDGLSEVPTESEQQIEEKEIAPIESEKDKEISPIESDKDKKIAPIESEAPSAPLPKPTESTPAPLPLVDNGQESAYPEYNNFNGAGGYGWNGYGAGYGMNGYGANGYGAGGFNGMYRGGVFNPNRNTDTYGPGVTNIDTYRGNGYGFGGRHYGGSNGVNNVADLDENEDISNDEIATIPLEKDEKFVTNVSQEKSITKQIDDDEKNCDECETPHFVTSQTRDEVVVKSVNGSEDESGEDKVKGHTALSISSDINKKIEKLIKK